MFAKMWIRQCIAVLRNFHNSCKACSSNIGVSRYRARSSSQAVVDRISNVGCGEPCLSRAGSLRNARVLNRPIVFTLLGFGLCMLELLVLKRYHIRDGWFGPLIELSLYLLISISLSLILSSTIITLVACLASSRSCKYCVAFCAAIWLCLPS